MSDIFYVKLNLDDDEMLKIKKDTAIILLALKQGLNKKFSDKEISSVANKIEVLTFGAIPREK